MLNEFFRELRRRRVLRVALIYVVCAGIGVLVVAAAFPLLGLPGWGVRVGVLGAVLGLPIALGLSWVFDINNGAVERTRALDPTPDEVNRTYLRMGVPGRPHSERGRLRLLLASAVVLVTVVGVTGWLATTRQAAAFEGLDDTLVAVLPFRITGADAGYRHLRLGMVDLIAARATGELRAVDASSVAAAFVGPGSSRDMTLRQSRVLAAELGAGAVLIGDVSGSREHLFVSASLVRTRDGRMVATAQLPGHGDSVPQLVDRLVAVLLRGDIR
jgi:TolB-like protein